ncbi:MAG: helix-turn-helix transcriptional regulator, partial [Anaerolineae bacterium]|nr:helix-turn-helix transcriptional regulator [Anaerolineae bacterium]
MVKVGKQMNSSIPSSESPAITTTQQLQLLLRSILTHRDQPCSLAEIARSTGLSVQALAKLANGQTCDPRLDTLRRLCRFYGISLDYFAGDTIAECQLYLRQQRIATAPALIQEIMRQAKDMSARSQDNLQIILRWLEATQP